jgi:hypothetical protein
LLELNVPTKELLAAATDKAFAGYPVACAGGLGKFTEARIPLNKTLKAGEEYVFEFTPAAHNDMAIVINDKQVIPFEKNGDKLTLKVTANKGKLLVVTMKADGGYDGVVIYMVK